MRWPERLRSLALALAALFAAAGSHAAQPGTVLVTGTNRGIGLEFVRQYAEAGWKVIATVRTAGSSAGDLGTLAKQHASVRIETLDVASDESIAALGRRLQGQPIDVLINNAGMLGELPPQTIGTLDRALFDQVLTTNAFGALKVSEALKPNLLLGQQRKVIALTSGLSSMQMTGRLGGFYAYRMSKAALNMGFRALAADWRKDGIVVGIVAPGQVDTDMLRASGFRGQGITTDESVTGLIGLIADMTAESSGGILNYDGQPIPW